MPARQVEREADDCEESDDTGVLPGDEEDGWGEDADDTDDDRCGRRADEGAFDYLDDFNLERASDAESIEGSEEAEVRGEVASRSDAFAIEAEDVAAVYEQLLHDSDASLDAAETAAFDDPLVREAIETGSGFDSTSFADPTELADLELRHQRPSRWGRLDLTIAWRRAWTLHPVTISLGPLPHGPIAQSYDTADHLLVLATWSR